MIRTIFILLLLVTTTACTSTTTFVRSSANYQDSLSKSKVVAILPPYVEVNQIDASNKKTRMYNYEDKAEDNLKDIFSSKMKEKGYNVKFVSRREIGEKKLSKDILETNENFTTLIDQLYSTGAWPHEKAFSIEQKMPSVTRIANSIDADLFILINLYSENKTSGAKTREFAQSVLLSVLSGIATGSVHTNTDNQLPPRYFSAKVAIIEAATGKVLWTHSVLAGVDDGIFANSDLDKADRDSLSLLFGSMLKDLPSI